MLTAKEKEAVRQLEMLAERFAECRNENDVTVSNLLLAVTEAHGANLLMRLGIVAEFPKSENEQPFDPEFAKVWQGRHGEPPKALLQQEFDQSESAEQLELLRLAWILTMNLTAEFGEKPPWLPTSRIMHGFAFTNLSDLKLRAISSAEFCRWLAWMIATRSAPYFKRGSQPSMPVLSPALLEMGRKLYEEKPEPTKDDLLSLGIGSNKAQALKEKMRDEGLDQSPRRQRRK